MSLTNFANGTETVDLLLFNTEPYPLGPALGASVLYANPTATAYVLNCMNGTNPAACGTYNQSVTIGPWAQTSAGAATGVYDAYINLSTQSATVSVHCDMSSTVPATCTMTQNLGGSDMPGATATAAVWTTPASNYSAFSWGYMPVTITAGQQKLRDNNSSATITSSPMSTGSVTSSKLGSGSINLASAGSSARTGSAGPSGSAVAAAASSTSNSGAQAYGPGMGSVALAAVVLGWFIR